MTQKERITTLLNALREGMPEAGPARAAWQELLDPACWKPVLPPLTKRPERLNCAGLLCRLRPLAQRLAAKPLPEDWAGYCYDAAKGFAFPEQGQADFAFHTAVRFSLLTLQTLLDLERAGFAYDPFWDFAFLSEEEYAAEPHAEEYRQFLRCWRQDFVYEMLRLCDELMPYTTLSHIAAVHHIAMLAARGLRGAGCPVSLAVVSAAAAVHDIGKFGCRPGERVPYLHYHYTAQWCARTGLPAVGQIAANHSTWDLELENLPAESLCLIYADFRAKEKRLDGRTVSVIYSLKQSFEVILSKLDNVDEQKHRRYRLVYSRLRDFEQLLRSAGVDVDEEGGVEAPAEPPQVNLQTAGQLMQTLVFRALRLNIEMMHGLTSEKSFTNFLESARSEKDWKHLRTYLEILREFSIYLGDGQKRQLVDFLYELLMHREGDIRHTAADILGLCIAQFHAGYRKQLPSDAEDVGREELMALWTITLGRIVCPDHKLTR